MPEKKLIDFGKNGETIKGLEVIDSHAHLGRYPGFVIYDSRIEDMIREMDRVGVSKTAISEMSALEGDFIYGNNQAKSAIDKFPDRVLGYIFVNPNFSYGLADEVERCLAMGGFKGIKVHVGCNYPYSGEKYKECWEVADKYKLPVLAHTWGDKDVETMGKVGRDFPKTKILLGHSGAEDFYKNIEQVRKSDNVYLEITMSRSPLGLIEKFVNEVGSERVVFGSDLPFISLTHQIGKVLFARISEKEKEDILSRNAKRIFGL